MGRFLLSLVAGICLANSALAEDRFSIQLSNGLAFDETAPKARVKYATEDFWRFSGRDFDISIMARIDFEAPPETSSEELNRRNTFVHMVIPHLGVKRRIGCDPTDPPMGLVNRTGLTEKKVEGSFQLEIVKCNDFYSGEALDLDFLPVKIEGTFSLSRTE